MIDVDNVDMALLPGMTATITIEVQKVENVLKIKNAALKMTREMIFGAKKRTWTPKDSSKVSGAGKQTGVADGHGAYGGGAGNGGKMWHGKNPAKPRVFVLKDGKPVPVEVTTGLVSDGETEVQGDLEPGTLVIIGVASGSSAQKAQQQSILGAGGPGMMRR
jgi:HlyD family secretion protein